MSLTYAAVAALSLSAPRITGISYDPFSRAAGAGVGVLANLPLNWKILGNEAGSRLALDSGALFFIHRFGDGINGTVASDWIQVPLLIRYIYGDFSLGGGFYAAKAVGKLRNEAGATQTYDGYGMGTWDAGLEASLRWTFFQGDALGYFFDARYAYGLINLSSLANTPRIHYDDIQIAFGIHFGGS